MVHVAARRKCRPMPTVRSASVANPCGVWTTERVAITRCTPTRPHALCDTCFRCPCQMRGRMGDPQNDSNGKTNAHLRLGQDPRTQHGGHHPQHLSRRHAGGEAGPQTSGRKENPAARRRRLDCRRGDGRDRHAPLSPVPPARREARRAAAAAGDAARLRPGCEKLRREHAHERHRDARALPCALP